MLLLDDLPVLPPLVSSSLLILV